MVNIFSSIFSTKKEVRDLDPKTFEKMINEEKDAVIVDVRTPDENLEARIPNSVLIDIYKSNFTERIGTLDHTKTYFVYCRTGSRSYSACKQMLKMGFEKVYNLESGIAGWMGKIDHG